MNSTCLWTPHPPFACHQLLRVRLSRKNQPEMTGSHRMVRPASGSPPLCRWSSVSPTGASPTLSDHSFHTRSVLGTSSSLCSALTKEASSQKSKATDSLFVSVSWRLCGIPSGCTSSFLEGFLRRSPPLQERNPSWGMGLMTRRPCGISLQNTQLTF